MRLPLLILLSALTSFQAIASEWTDRERELGFAAFPEIAIASYSTAPSEALAREARKTLSEAVEVIRINPGPWFAAVAPGKSMTTAEIERILQGAPGIPLRVCSKSCAPCGSSTSACLAARDLGLQSMGTMMFIRQCALETKGCEGQTLNLRSFFEESLAVFAHYKLMGPVPRDRARKNASQASRVISTTANQVNGILSRCPGPYTQDDFRFLNEMGSLGAPDETHRSCGEAYRAVADRKMKSCPKPSQVSAVYRCDEKCQGLLCMAKSKTPQLRTIGTRTLLLLRKDSCIGNEAKHLPEFTKQIQRGGC